MDSRPVVSHKLVLLGDTSVGKSCLVVRFCRYVGSCARRRGWARACGLSGSAAGRTHDPTRHPHSPPRRARLVCARVQGRVLRLSGADYWRCERRRVLAARCATPCRTVPTALPSAAVRSRLSHADGAAGRLHRPIRGARQSCATSIAGVALRRSSTHRPLHALDSRCSCGTLPGRSGTAAWRQCTIAGRARRSLSLT